MNKILLIEDESYDFGQIENALIECKWEVVPKSHDTLAKILGGEDFLSKMKKYIESVLENEELYAAIVDLGFNGDPNFGLEIIKYIKTRLDLYLPIIVFTKHSESLRDAITDRATFFLEKPSKNDLFRVTSSIISPYLEAFKIFSYSSRLDEMCNNQKLLISLMTMFPKSIILKLEEIQKNTVENHKLIEATLTLGVKGLKEAQKRKVISYVKKQFDSLEIMGELSEEMELNLKEAIFGNLIMALKSGSTDLLKTAIANAAENLGCPKEIADNVIFSTIWLLAKAILSTRKAIGIF